MQFLGSNFRKTLPCAVLLVAFGLAGCGNSCFVAFSNNGNGGVIIKAGNPAPSCSLMPANPAVRALVVKSPICENCTAAASAEHIFLTVRSIRLRAANNADPEEWFEIAPQLASEPRQIDLIGSQPEILLDHASIPAGTYRELQLQFLSESPANTEYVSLEKPCGDHGWNCIVTADRHVQPIGQPDLIMPLKSYGNIPLLFLPDSTMDLRLNLAASTASLYFSDSTGIMLRPVIVGHVAMVRHDATIQQTPAPD